MTTDKKPIDWQHPFTRPNGDGLREHINNRDIIFLVDGYVSTPHGHVIVLYHAVHPIPTLDLSVIHGGVNYCRSHVGEVARHTIVTYAARFAAEVAEKVAKK